MERLIKSCNWIKSYSLIYVKLLLFCRLQQKKKTHVSPSIYFFTLLFLCNIFFNLHCLVSFRPILRHLASYIGSYTTACTIQKQIYNLGDVKSHSREYFVKFCYVSVCLRSSARLTSLKVRFLSWWVCSDWTTCSDAPHPCPLIGCPSCPSLVWSLHVPSPGRRRLLSPHLARGGPAASERSGVWLWEDRGADAVYTQIHDHKHTHTHWHS